MTSLKYRPQVEALEERVALSRAPVLLDAPQAFSPEKRETVVTVQVTLPPGYGWFLEVRGRNGKWSWKGPFGDKTRARTAFVRKGLRVRGAELVLPPETPQSSDLGAGWVGPEGPTGPGQQVGYEVMFWGVDVWGQGDWRSLNPRHIFPTYSDALQEASWRDTSFPFRHTVREVPM